jgi:hypothetical protein
MSTDLDYTECPDCGGAMYYPIEGDMSMMKCLGDCGRTKVHAKRKACGCFMPKKHKGERE